jgi:hypothetical protein
MATRNRRRRPQKNTSFAFARRPRPKVCGSLWDRHCWLNSGSFMQMPARSMQKKLAQQAEKSQNPAHDSKTTDNGFRHDDARAKDKRDESPM